MKKTTLKKVVAILLAAVFAVGVLGCSSSSTGTTSAATSAAVEKKGKILWLSNLSSGAQYEAQMAYATELCKEMGYDFGVCYGDSYNDPDGNLTNVKNAMTSDVVGLLVSQDGGIQAIMDEYPNLWVAGFNSDFNSVYGDGGSNAAVASYEKWLGTIADGHINGEDTAQQMFDYVKSQGWTKIGVCNFPAYAYPNLGVAADKMTELCEAAGIEIVGGYVTLQFQPLEENYFQEPGRDDLDAIVALCAGTSFVYPTMVQAKADGLCSSKTVLVTSGYDDDASLIADIGDDKTIRYLTISPNEDIAYSLYLLNLAITGKMYSDFKAERIDAAEYVIDSTADITAVTTKSLLASGHSYTNATITLADLQATTTFAGLQELFHGEKVSVDYLEK